MNATLILTGGWVGASSGGGGGGGTVDTSAIASAVWSYSKRLLTAGGVQVEEDSDTQDFSLKQGEYKQVTIAVVDSSNVPVNLTGYTLDWGLWRGSTRLLTKSYGSGITLVNVSGTNDGLRITLAASDTRTLAPGTYYHECRVTNASSQPEVVAAGDVKINESKTA